MKLFGETKYENLIEESGREFYTKISFSLQKVEKDDIEELNKELREYFKRENYQGIRSHIDKSVMRYSHLEFSIDMEVHGGMSNVLLKGKWAEDIDSIIKTFIANRENIEKRVA